MIKVNLGRKTTYNGFFYFVLLVLVASIVFTFGQQSSKVSADIKDKGVKQETMLQKNRSMRSLSSLKFISRFINL